MSQTDSFVDEVTEELRRDRLFRLFRRWSPYVIALLVLLVAASAWNEWRKAALEAEREAAGDALLAATRAATPEARLTSLEALRGGVAAGMLALRFAEAGALATAGRADDAAVRFQALADDQDLDPIYRDLARLRLLALRGSAMAPAERIALLDAMTGPDAPFRLLALEGRAIAHHEAGDADKAAQNLRSILADPFATEALRGRTVEFLNAIGGSAEPAPAQQ
ncbi:MAG TPA: hypothetical protein VFR34_16035 [Paracoccaceae bacterium]|nr:hypothetical protein [Paracoccaceae bacterium]